MGALENLRGEKLSLLRGHNVLFRDLSFTVSAGETLSVEGPNGVGKTSLLRLIAGFLAPAAGRVALTLQGGDVVDDMEERGAFVGWLGHQDGIKPQLTPRENLQFFARYQSCADVGATLTRVGLGRTADYPAQYLSAGQRRRLALARLIIASRPLWLLDEPLSALDMSGRMLAADLIQEHAKSGGMTLAATHEPLGIPCRSLAL